MTYPCLWFSLLTAGCFCRVTVETGRGSKDSSLSVACLCIHMSHLYGLEGLTCKNKHYKRKGLWVRGCSKHCSACIKYKGSWLAGVLNASFPEGCSTMPYSGWGDNVHICKMQQSKAEFSQLLFPSWRIRNLDSFLRVISTICKSQTVCVALPHLKNQEEGALNAVSRSPLATFRSLHWPQWENLSHTQSWMDPAFSIHSSISHESGEIRTLP